MKGFHAKPRRREDGRFCGEAALFIERRTRSGVAMEH
jgi:hypothetical protein